MGGDDVQEVSSVIIINQKKKQSQFNKNETAYKVEKEKGYEIQYGETEEVQLPFILPEKCPVSPFGFESCNKTLETLQQRRCFENLQILDDFIRFDVTRAGAICCSGYRISVQYDDEFLYGNAQQSSCCLGGLFSSEKCIRFSTKKDLLVDSGNSGDSSSNSSNRSNSSLEFSILFPSLFFRFRPKRRKFSVSLSLRNSKDINEEELLGDVEIFAKDVVVDHNTDNTDNADKDKDAFEINNLLEKCAFTMKQLRTNTFLINNEEGLKVGTIEVFRGLRGGITSYGLSIMDDSVSPSSKALFISSVIALDVEERESELTCSFLWTPLISIFIILFFTILPWMYFRQQPK